MAPPSPLCRLATSVPPPRYPTVKYAGALAPASSWRSRVVPPRVAAETAETVLPPLEPEGSIAVPCTGKEAGRLQAYLYCPYVNPRFDQDRQHPYPGEGLCAKAASFARVARAMITDTLLACSAPFCSHARPMSVLDEDEVRELARCATAAGLDRMALLAGVNPTFVASLKTSDAPAGQVLLDLFEMNRVGKLADNSVPLRQWLRNAGTLKPELAAQLPFVSAVRHVDAFDQKPAASEGVSGKCIFVYVSFAEEDRHFFQALQQSFKPLIDRKEIALSCSRCTSNDDRSSLDQASLILVLASPAYLSLAHTHQEATLIAERSDCTVVPIRARPCPWESSPLGRLPLIPAKGSALVSGAPAYVEVAAQVKETVERLIVKAD